MVTRTYQWVKKGNAFCACSTKEPQSSQHLEHHIKSCRFSPDEREPVRATARQDIVARSKVYSIVRPKRVSTLSPHFRSSSRSWLQSNSISRSSNLPAGIWTGFAQGSAPSTKGAEPVEPGLLSGSSQPEMARRHQLYLDPGRLALPGCHP